MRNDSHSKNLEEFLSYMKAKNPTSMKQVSRTMSKMPRDFELIGGTMCAWAKTFLGDNWVKIISDGYAYFVKYANSSQITYSQTGSYKYDRYSEVNLSYQTSEHMDFYHWGVFATTFLWEHHLRIVKFFVDNFVSAINEGENLLELGSGSGVWGLLLSSMKEGVCVQGVDISGISVKLAMEMARVNGFGEASYVEGDALVYRHPQKILFDCGISCFLLEHLENPIVLLQNICANLKTGGFAFVTAALTASEEDHIFEFRRESEIITMAENAGFRVVATMSSSPAPYPEDMKFLPRSMALVLQKRRNQLW